MLGFFAGFAVAMLLVGWKLRRMRRGLGRRRFGRRFILRRVFSKLQTDETQEREIADAMDELLAVAGDLKSEMRDMRRDLADVLRSSPVDGVADDGLLDTLAERQSALMGQARDAFRSTVDRVYAALDEVQRQQLADLVEHGPHATRA